MSQKFTVDWFSHNIPIWTETFDSLGWLHSATNLRVLEVGSWEGQSACWLLQHVCCSSGSRLVCIDNWAGAVQYGSAAKDWGLSEEQHHATAVLQRFRDNIEAVQGTDKVTVLQQPSWVALSTMMQNDLDTFDVVYIDGSHLPQDVLTDAAMAWKLLKNEGIMIFDDYQWDQVVCMPKAKTPQKAIDAFLEVFSEELHVMRLEYQCIVQKRTSH
ncbi:hypothetical protein ABBQ32_013519 [Trebouxia sp. C0010 RCD-2024]